MNITRENLSDLELCIKVDIEENDYIENVQKKYGRRFLIRPIKDYKHLNERRKSIGLDPIEKSILYKNAIIPQKYIKHWNKQRKHLEL